MQELRESEGTEEQKFYFIFKNKNLKSFLSS
jgi:hypothetical protein